jgi:hypothetical protein
MSDLVYYYPTPEEALRLEARGIPAFCGACGSLLPQRRIEGDPKSKRGGGRLREYCPNPGEERARSTTTSCRTMQSQLIAVDRYLPTLPYPDTEQGRQRRADHEALLLALRNTIHAAGERAERRRGAAKGQVGLFGVAGPG